MEQETKFAIAPQGRTLENEALIKQIAAKAPQEKGPQIID